MKVGTAMTLSGSGIRKVRLAILLPRLDRSQTTQKRTPGGPSRILFYRTFSDNVRYLEEEVLLAYHADRPVPTHDQQPSHLQG